MLKKVLNISAILFIILITKKNFQNGKLLAIVKVFKT